MAIGKLKAVRVSANDENLIGKDEEPLKLVVGLIDDDEEPHISAPAAFSAPAAVSARPGVSTQIVLETITECWYSDARQKSLRRPAGVSSQADVHSTTTTRAIAEQNCDRKDPERKKT